MFGVCVWVFGPAVQLGKKVCHKYGRMKFRYQRDAAVNWNGLSDLKKETAVRSKAECNARSEHLSRDPECIALSEHLSRDP